MAKKVVLPSRTFASRSTAKNYIRDEILHSYPLRTRIPAGTHHRILAELLELHSDAVEKIGPGIDHFYVEETYRLPGKEAVGRDKRVILVVRTDGTTRDWSYRHVIDEPTTAANVKSALAFALEPERLRRRDEAFASGVPVVCALTGSVIEQKHQADTQHLSPTWAELTKGFAISQGGWDAIETHSGDGHVFIGRDVQDLTIRDAWLDYYATHARPTFVKNELPLRP